MCHAGPQRLKQSVQIALTRHGLQFIMPSASRRKGMANTVNMDDRPQGFLVERGRHVEPGHEGRLRCIIGFSGLSGAGQTPQTGAKPALAIDASLGVVTHLQRHSFTSRAVDDGAIVAVSPGDGAIHTRKPGTPFASEACNWNLFLSPAQPGEGSFY
jgi:hypothetical protein